MEEVKEGYRQHYGVLMKEEELERMFGAIDSDFSGFIDYSEFVIAAMNQK